MKDISSNQNPNSNWNETFSKLKIDLNWFFEEDKQKIKDHICSICLGVCNDPMIVVDCSHMFCNGCITKELNNNKGCQVVDCKNTLIKLDSVKSIPMIKNIIGKKMLECKNKDCKWSGQFVNFKDHLRECEKELICCENVGCGIEFLRETQNSHNEICEYKLKICSKCKEEYKGLEINHQENCRMRLELCKNNCGLEIEKKYMEKHLKSECGNLMMYCDYYQYGCKAQFKKNETQTHLDEFEIEHSTICNNFSRELKQDYENKCNTLEQSFNELKENVENCERFINFMKQENLDISPQLNAADDINKLNKISEDEIVVNKDIKKFIGKKHHRNKKNNHENNDLEILEEEPTKIKIPLKTKTIIENNINDDHKIENNNNNVIFSPMKSDKYGFLKVEKIFITPGLRVTGDGVVLAKTDSVYQHQFALINNKLNNNNEFAKWKIDFTFAKRNDKWAGFGVCCKEFLEKNSKLNFNTAVANHGLFIITTDSMIYNSNSSSKNNKKIPNINKYAFASNPLSIEFEYNNIKKSLNLKISESDFNFDLLDIFCIQTGLNLLPCVILKNSFDEFYYHKLDQ